MGVQDEDSGVVPLTTLTTDKNRLAISNDGLVNNDSKKGGIRDVEELNILPSSEVLSSPLQKWNEPHGNILRFASAFYAIFVFGLSDAAYGESFVSR